MTHHATVLILLSGKNCKDSFWRSCSQTVHLAWITHMNMKLNLFAKWLDPNPPGRGRIIELCSRTWGHLWKSVIVPAPRLRCSQSSVQISLPSDVTSEKSDMESSRQVFVLEMRCTSVIFSRRCHGHHKVSLFLDFIYTARSGCEWTSV